MDSIDSTMTPITDRKIETSGYDMQRQALENKIDVPDNQPEPEMPMDATPLDAVMDAPAAPEEQFPPSIAPSMAVAPVAAPRQSSAAALPLDLTPDQMDALVAGLVAALLTSDMVQGKIAEIVPSAFSVDGGMTMTGTVVVAAAGAAAFMLARRAVSQ